MWVHRRVGGVTIYAPAKLNLFFEVIGKRSDGFHEIETLMAPFSLYDTLHLSAAAVGATGEIRFSVQSSRPRSALFNCTTPAAIPTAGDNLVVRALSLLRDRYKVREGAEVRLVKRIPAGAGLGGGSSDAAAALVGGNRLWKLELTQEELAEAAAELGSDVPFFLHRSAAVCRGRGEQVSPLGGPASFWAVLVCPGQALSTREVYAACSAAGEPRSVDAAARAYAQGDLTRLAAQLHNRLENAAQELSPGLAEVQREINHSDVVGACMTGSGSGCFALCRHARHARRTAQRLRARRLGEVFCVRSAA